MSPAFDGTAPVGAEISAEQARGTFEIMLFTKKGGPLTKRISLVADNRPVSDGSACKMTQGDRAARTLRHAR